MHSFNQRLWNALQIHGNMVQSMPTWVFSLLLDTGNKPATKYIIMERKANANKLLVKQRNGVLWRKIVGWCQEILLRTQHLYWSLKDGKDPGRGKAFEGEQKARLVSCLYHLTAWSILCWTFRPSPTIGLQDPRRRALECEDLFISPKCTIEGKIFTIDFWGGWMICLEGTAD